MIVLKTAFLEIPAHFLLRGRTTTLLGNSHLSRCC